MSMEDLIVRLQIEEDNRASKKKGLNPAVAKVNIVKHDQSSKSKKNEFGKGSKLGPKGGILKKQKFQEKYFNYDKVGYKSVDCKLPKKKKNHEANMVDDISQDVVKICLFAIVLR